MSTNIYTRQKYRKVWEDHHGPIPKDSNGVSYEIHHIDGDPSNNSIENLACVSIEEHYNIHYEQKDYGAAFLIAGRMNRTPDEISEIASKAGKASAEKMLKNGTHNFQTIDRSKTIYFYSTEEGKQVRRQLNKEMYENNTNKFFDPEACRERTKKRIEDGTHNLVGSVTCRNKSGEVVQVPKDTYYSQEGSKSDWEFAAVSSTEGKQRKK